MTLVGLGSVKWLVGRAPQGEKQASAVSGEKPPQDYSKMSLPELFDIADMYMMSSKKEAYDFELASLNGETVSLNELRGKTVVINFWTTW